jgi:predicted aldo/keto reductase-like oxidoreductase
MSVNINFWSRREFLKIAGTAGLGIMSGAKLHKLGVAATDQESGLIPVRPFGRTGVSVPILGFGGSQNLASKQRLLRQAVKLGVTYWDTAENYAGGGSEEAMGQYFLDYPADRKKVFLVTKSHATRPSGLSASLEESLERLETKYIDLYFIHGISDIDEMDDDVRIWADRAKGDGKIRLIGFSSHSNMEECMMGAAKLGWIDGIMVTYNYRLMHTDAMKQAVEACVRAGIGITAMKTQAGWSWGRIGRKTSATEQLIKEISKKGYSAKQAKLRAVWENPHISSICSEMTNFKILMSNAAAARNQIALSREDHRVLNRYARETAPEYCAGCSAICEPLCETKPPICDTMRFLMYSRCYGEAGRAASLFREIPPHVRERMVKLDYTAAEVACPQGMPIGRLMREAVAEFT